MQLLKLTVKQFWCELKNIGGGGTLFALLFARANVPVSSMLSDGLGDRALLYGGSDVSCTGH